MQNKSYDFVGKLKMFVSISLAIVLIGVVINIVFGTALDIDFKGGSKITYSYENDINADKVIESVKKSVNLDVTTTENKDYTSGTTSIVLTVVGDLTISTKQIDTITKGLSTDLKSNNLINTNVNSVAPTIGYDFFKKALYSLVIASFLVILYVGLRFKNIGGVSAGATALLALVHDMVIVYFTNVIFRIPLDLNFIAVELTILGYSLNDTIVIYDRIRENQKIYGDSLSHKALVNLSITQSFKRSLVTSLATFIAISVVWVVAAIAGLDTILSFAVPMSIGIISGSYSTICIAGPVYVKWLEFKDKHNSNKNGSKPDYVNKNKKKKAKA